MSKRSVFEDVAGPAAAPVPAGASRDTSRTGIFIWLMILGLLVVVMVLVGGATRLTDSGLSITEWAPVMGALPPLSVADWDAAFAAYKTTTEFQEQNAWMTLADFKPIYWWEWGHRLLGRLIGVVWLVGFLWFLLRRRIPERWTGRLLLLGLLGGLQGAIGWWMVASGLTDRLDVAPYRLAVHLGLAFFIFALILWYALRIRRDPAETLERRRRRIVPLMGWSSLMIVLVFVQILSGALVAGLDAGRGHVDWPLMQGQFFPAEALDMQPVWLNIFENPALAQFDHRMIAYVIFLVTIAFVIRSFCVAHAKVRVWVRRVGVIVLAQMVLGIVTVMNAAPLGLALGHQALALLLVGALIHARFEIAYPGAQKISA
ncbi:MAG: COX15/CtaA family protein [Paracoccaceae bacterium]